MMRTGLRLAGRVVLIGMIWANGAWADCPNLGQPRIITHHQATIGGKAVEYDATVGYTEVTAADAQSKGCIFFTTYVASGTADITKRPVIFAFNGGPGSASLWLHLGMIGPKRVDMGPDGLDIQVPSHLIDNNESLLDVADLVLIDPVSTGFSGAEGSADPFFGVKNDYTSVAEFVRSYLNEFGRWGSPKYVMGESYGGIRASLLAHYLQSNEQMGIALNGAILISPALTTTTINFGDPDNDLPYVLYLPSFAATALYHGRIGGAYRGMTADQVFTLARTFAEGPYFDALLKGDQLSPEDFSEIARQVSELTGIPKAQVEDLNLRVADSDFFGGILQDQNRIVGRIDSRFVGGRLPTENGSTAEDPSLTEVEGTFTSTINSYLRDELGVRTNQPYLTFGNITAWPYDTDGSEFGVMPDLNRALIENPFFKVYVASGFYDLACPTGTVLYDFDHLAPRLGLGSRVKISRFESGHMVYIRQSALQRMKAELSQFLAE